jgi:5-methylcytosine-specific restriction protein A
MKAPKKRERPGGERKPHEGRGLDPFYNSSAWRKNRTAFIQEHPLCVECEREGRVHPGSVVDHIQPRHFGGDDFSWDNLQTLCKRHHDQKSATERRAKQ